MLVSLISLMLLGHVTVTPTTVVTHGDTVPRFAANAEFVAIRSGNWSDPRTWNLSSVPSAGAKVSIPQGIDVDYDLKSPVKLDAVEISGRLDFKTNVDTSLWLRELMVMPDGVLTIGEPGNQVQANVSAEIVFIDSPLRTTTIDPSQYGSGLLAFGEVTIYGHQLENTFVRIDGDALAGSAQINLQESASDWRIGDFVVVPDTRHISPVALPGYYVYKPQWEIRKITAIDGSQVDGVRITVDAPLAFNHQGPRDASGSGTVNFDGKTLAAHVGNLSRNVTLRSENPNGVRGHSQFFANAEIDIRYAAFEELGRTEAEPLDNTRFDQAGNVTHIGTNQIGRYSQHFHHIDGPIDGILANGQRYQWVAIGNVINGSGKWGTAIHNSHFGLLQDNVYYNIDGSAVATEDGSEFRNVIDSNFVVRVNGNARASKAKDNGDQGDGLWFAGPMNTVTNNVVTNVVHIGINVNPDDIPNKTVSVPTAPGSVDRRTTNLLKEVVANFNGNEIYGATDAAVLLWNVGDRRLYYPNEPGVNTLKNTAVWHVLSSGIVLYYMDSIVIDGWIQRGDPFMFRKGFTAGGPRDPAISSVAGAAIWIGGANARDIEIKNADIQNMTYGLINRGRGFADQIDVVDSYFDNLFNVINLPWTQDPKDGVRDLVLTNVDFGDVVSPGAKNTIDMEWYSPTPNEATKRESVTVYGFGGVTGLILELFYLEQVVGGTAENVPPGMLPAGIVAPVERDGDNGQAATLRGRALGIKGLVFEKTKLPSPHLFANVELNAGKPTLYFATLGDSSSVSGVSFKIDEKVFDFPYVNGSVDLSFLTGNGTYKIEGSLTLKSKTLLMRWRAN